jgi:hypothetical protein
VARTASGWCQLLPRNGVVTDRQRGNTAGDDRTDPRHARPYNGGDHRLRPKNQGWRWQNVLHPSLQIRSNSDGSIVNDPLMNARRPRVVLQGDSSAGSSPLRTLVFYRQSSVIEPGAPADVVLHRGLKDTLADPASTGFRSADLEPYSSATNMSDPGALLPGDNALAHRSFMRGSFIAFGYSYTPDLVASDPDRTNPPTQTNNFYVRTSNDSGASWSAPHRVSNFLWPGVSVAEPRLVPTSEHSPNLTGVPDPGDTQNTDAFTCLRVTSTHRQTGLLDLRSRTTDSGASYELTGMLTGGNGQSESQLRVLPDGSAAAILWMQEMAPTAERDVMFTQLAPAFVPDVPDVPDNSNSGGDIDINGRCFIATAAYGSPMAQDVKLLRAFRDQYLLTNEPGHKFVELYYSVSPWFPNASVSKFRRSSASLRPLVELSRQLVSNDHWWTKVTGGDA